MERVGSGAGRLFSLGLFSLPFLLSTSLAQAMDAVALE